MGINYLNVQVSQFKEKHRVINNQCLQDTANIIKVLENLPDVTQLRSGKHCFICPALFSKCSLAYLCDAECLFMAEGTHPLSRRSQGSVRLALGRLAFLSPGETLDLQGKSLRERLHLHNSPPLPLP